MFKGTVECYAFNVVLHVGCAAKNQFLNFKKTSKLQITFYHSNWVSEVKWKFIKTLKAFFVFKTF